MMGKVTFRQHLRCRSARRSLIIKGWVAERLKAAVLKTAVRASVPWVRIPPHPPFEAVSIYYGESPTIYLVAVGAKLTTARADARLADDGYQPGMFDVWQQKHIGLPGEAKDSCHRACGAIFRRTTFLCLTYYVTRAARRRRD